jgi:hypothetical protein
VARQEVVRVVCDRCQRGTTDPKNIADSAIAQALGVETVKEKTKYNDLCGKCLSRIDKLFSEIVEMPEREKKE